MRIAPKIIEDFIQRHNENPQPFIWTATVQDILEKVRRARTCSIRWHLIEHYTK